MAIYGGVIVQTLGHQKRRGNGLHWYGLASLIEYIPIGDHFTVMRDSEADENLTFCLYRIDYSQLAN